MHVEQLAHVYVYARQVPDVVGRGALQFVQSGRGWYATCATKIRADTEKKRSGISRPWRSEVRLILRTQKRKMEWVNLARNLKMGQTLSAGPADLKNAIRVSTLASLFR